MILTLAFRNLFHDRVRLAVTLIGILFSIVLVAVQLGLYLGSSRMITSNIDNARGELWITAFGAKSFEDGGLLLHSAERHQALADHPRWKAYPSVTNFFLVRTPDAKAAWEALLARGILVRRQDHYAGLEGCLRITVGTRAENDAFLAAAAEAR